jgi:hypothetical protein
MVPVKASDNHSPKMPVPTEYRIRLAQYLARARADLSFAIIDAVVVATSYTSAMVLRFMDIQGIAPDWWRSFAISLPVIVAVHIVANLAFGAYGHVWEYASVEEAMRLVFAAIAAAGILVGLLLIAEAGDLPWLQPLYQAAPAVALIVEAGTRGQLPRPARFPPTLELTLVTRDGSTGYLGPLENDGPTPVGVERALPRLRELVAWAECICIAGDMARYPALARLIRDVRFQSRPDFAQALVRVSMPCGVGVCDICRVTTRHGERRACVDGPVFDLMDFLE